MPSYTGPTGAEHAHKALGATTCSWCGMCLRDHCMHAGAPTGMNSASVAGGRRRSRRPKRRGREAGRRRLRVKLLKHGEPMDAQRRERAVELVAVIRKEAEFQIARPLARRHLKALHAPQAPPVRARPARCADGTACGRGVGRHCDAVCDGRELRAGDQWPVPYLRAAPVLGAERAEQQPRRRRVVGTPEYLPRPPMRRSAGTRAPHVCMYAHTRRMQVLNPVEQL
jgi:hypothetical protein